MVGAGFALLAAAAWYWWAWLRGGRRLMVPGRWLSWALVASGFLSFAALQAGWFVTEFGRQPWVVSGYLRTSEGVTEQQGILAFFVAFTVLYVVIGAALIVALVKWPHGPRVSAAPGSPAGKEAERVS